MKIVFWLCLGLISYTYLIYPLFALLLAKLNPTQTEGKSTTTPPVVMLIAAYNEEDVLPEKIENCLSLDYPQDKIRFIIGSDGSSDATNQILSAQNHPQIQFELFETREGKSSVLNKLVSKVNEEIIIFSDANTIYHPESVTNLVRHFTNLKIGGVCGKLSLQNESGTLGGEGEVLYWRYENMIKEAEGIINSVISANGAIFAIRKELFSPLPTEIIVNDDFSITLMVLQKKLRVVYEPLATAVEKASPDMDSEFVRKVRISSLNFNGLPEIIPLMHPRYGFTALAIFSHKILRWFVPVLGFGLLLSNLFLFPLGGIYQVVLFGQGIIYGGALLGYIGDQLFGNAGPMIPFYYLVMTNFALVVGFWRSITRTQKQAWDRVPH